MPGLSVFRYDLPFEGSFDSSRGSIKQRAGLIITNESDIWSEIAPLEGFSKESIDQAHVFLANHFTRLQHHFEKQSIDTFLSEYHSALADLPSVRFGLSMLSEQQKALKASKPLYSYWIASKQKNIPHPLPVPGRIHLNAVIDLSKHAMAPLHLSNLQWQGFSCFKIKLPLSLDKSLRLISELETLPLDNQTLRFDANQAFNFDETGLLVKALENMQSKVPTLTIEYLEEPLAEPSDDALLKLSKKEIPLAADESVRNLSIAKKKIKTNAFRYLVLKPSLFGSFSELTMVARLIPEGFVVVSSALESPVGRFILAHVAAFFDPSATRSHGLATGHLFTGKQDSPFIKLPKDSGLGFLKEINDFYLKNKSVFLKKVL